MPQQVNLDALIPREDFAINEGGSTSQFGQTIQIRDLEEGSFFYPILRKPDFQRETADWTPDKISSFIESYISGDLIPAIILWQSGVNIFVIDGGHRLSALIAWVSDDYGDGDISRQFFEHQISDEQKKIAEKTRKEVSKKIGSYKDLQHAARYPDRANQEHVEKAKKLGFTALQLQWVTGDAEKAEESFFKINQHAAPIDKTELRLLNSRQKPNAIASRAIIRAGKGHKYWSSFSLEAQDTIEELSNHINNLLFSPTFQTPIKTLDLPVAGKGYSAGSLNLLLDLINLANNKTESQVSNDLDGSETINFLKTTKRILSRITGQHPSSLGLHPIVYFYSVSGRYQPTSFLAAIEFVKWLDQHKKLKQFISAREGFENFMLQYKSIPNQITNKFGSGAKKGHRRLFEFYVKLLNLKLEGTSDTDIVENISKDDIFGFLQFSPSFTKTNESSFSNNVKSTAFIQEALKNPIRCQICQGLIHKNSTSFDHIQRKENGGTGSAENAQLAHPYCNSTYKN
ncbi:DUF262 domain-containing protein [uncultured Kushneria sp.]|uniref:HNH endonuclease family protein n=1 Tax=uncultured Kushneria sp. TaxID=905033 RepID=UPI00262C58DE|nr:DUF262 domain-containing protein [uncultured Kushneria sp.]